MKEISRKCLIFPGSSPLIEKLEEIATRGFGSV